MAIGQRGILVSRTQAKRLSKPQPPKLKPPPMSTPQNPTPEENLGLWCPAGGTFYICQTSAPRFLGCCETDPCASGGQCAADALRPASYSVRYYAGQHQSCAWPYDESEWYTCDFATPPFLGCCARDPCDAGCPDVDLVPARLDDDDDVAAPFLAPGTCVGGASTCVAASTPGSTESGLGGETENSNPDMGESSQTRSSRRTGLIVGLSMMGVVIMLILVGFWIWRHKKADLRESRSPRPSRSSSSSSEDSHDRPEMAVRDDDETDPRVGSQIIQRHNRSWAFVGEDLRKENVSPLSEGSIREPSTNGQLHVVNP
ncbi:hypothetical protein M426DRAFT_18427 [Hypoxylon sp. CI-4A]|nr:hypothetical protein M426DRAFT_18427 [Hypoxylon sp. CI-4A]